MSEPGAPTDFGGRVIPQTNPPTVPQDSEGGPATVTPTAKFNIDNAPLPDADTQKAFPELKGPAQNEKLTRPNKNGFDPIGDVMREFKIPMTRENYVALNHLGDTADATPEEDAEMPKRFQPAYPTHEELANEKAKKPSTK
jgi:hypothetical protein